MIQARWIKAGDKSSKLFYKQFKDRLAAAKDIPELLTNEGIIEKIGDGMARLATEFFSNILGKREDSPPRVNKEALQQVLLAQSDKLTVLRESELNAPLTLGELAEAAFALANDKCPGPDGTTVEFYKAHWQTLGTLVLQCIIRGIEEENFPEFLTKGTIVLLKKKADQRMLANKRPTILLNMIDKIRAKAIHRRVTPILQRIISPQQTAFLPGQNIHHALLLMRGMLHQAQQSGHEHILMKLDVCKAFDTMEWPYILPTVAKAGMNGVLSCFLKACFQSATSNIILNGHQTQSFRLARSVRQGCPLSPPPPYFYIGI